MLGWAGHGDPGVLYRATTTTTLVIRAATPTTVAANLFRRSGPHGPTHAARYFVAAIGVSLLVLAYEEFHSKRVRYAREVGALGIGLCAWAALRPWGFASLVVLFIAWAAVVATIEWRTDRSWWLADVEIEESLGFHPTVAITNTGMEAEFEAEVLHLIGKEEPIGGHQRSWAVRWRDEPTRRVRLLHSQTGTLEIGDFDLTTYLITHLHHGDPAPSWSFHKPGGEDVTTTFLPEVEGQGPAFHWLAEIRLHRVSPPASRRFVLSYKYDNDEEIDFITGHITGFARPLSRREKAVRTLKRRWSGTLRWIRGSPASAD